MFNNIRIRIESKARAVSELQESKSCLTTSINKKMVKEANSFAKGASESRIAGASQSQKTNNNPTRKDRRITIATQEANNNCKKPANKRTTIAKRKTNRTDHHRMAKDKRITIAGQEANHNRKVKDTRITIAKANHNRMPKDKRITIAKANRNRKLNDKRITIAERKAKHNRKASETTIANRNETMTGTRFSENIVEDF